MAFRSSRPSRRIMGEKDTAGDLPKLAKPAQRALASAGIASLTDVASWSQAELATLHGMGPNAIVTLEAALASRGLTFKET